MQGAKCCSGAAYFLTYCQADWNCTSQSQSVSQDFEFSQEGNKSILFESIISGFQIMLKI